MKIVFFSYIQNIIAQSPKSGTTTTPVRTEINFITLLIFYYFNYIYLQSILNYTYIIYDCCLPLHFVLWTYDNIGRTYGHSKELFDVIGLFYCVYVTNYNNLCNKI